MRKWLLASVMMAGLLAWQAEGLQARQSGQAGQSAGQTKQESPKPGAKPGKADADTSFVRQAATGGMSEVELGRMAANQASHDDVKKFGQRMVDDHSKANNELSALAQKKNIELPTELSKKEQAARDHLTKLSGAEFDKAYMQHMVADHTRDVRLFQRQAKTGKDPDIKAWAQQTLPVLEEHLKQAKDVASAVGASKGAGKKPEKK